MVFPLRTVKKPTNNIKILVIFIIIVILASGGILYYLYSPEISKAPDQSQGKEASENPNQEPPKPVLVESTLDGTMVTPEKANVRPLAVMIENHPQARPQTGLADASIVYETLAEGGITRFMAIYGPSVPDTAGPVRSARTYYVDWAQDYNALYTHFGGANDALKKIKNDGVADIDGMKLSGYFWRKWYPGVTGSEHTAFTNPTKLYQYAASKKWPTEGNFTKYTFKDDIAIAERPSTGTLSIDYSGNSNFAAKFTYDQATNTYSRYMAGIAHKDRITGKQISSKNIIVQYTKEIYKSGKKDHDLQTVGTGIAKIYLDGKEINGTWSKSNTKARTIFKDESGNQIVFNRGQTWIAVVRPNAPVKWIP